MDFFKVVKERFSYRGGFKNERVPRADLQRIVQAGLDAPSGKNAQTTEFVIVDDPSLVNNIRQMHTGNKAMQQAQAYIACLVDKAPEAIYEGHAFQIEDCAAAVENMLLALTALGYGSVWIDGWLRGQNHAPKIGKWLGVPETKIVRVLLPIGIPCEPYPRPAKKSFEQRAWFNVYASS